MIDITTHPLIGRKCRQIDTQDPAVIIGVQTTQAGEHALRLAWTLNDRIYHVDQHWRQGSGIELLELVE